VSMLYIEDAVRLLLSLAVAPAAANEVFFLSSGEAIRVGDLSRRIAQALGMPIRPVGLPAWCWGLVRGLAWAPGLTRLVPWRLLHILDDGLWCDNTKVSRLCPFELVQLDAGLTRTFAPSDSQSDRQPVRN